MAPYWIIFIITVVVCGALATGPSLAVRPIRGGRTFVVVATVTMLTLFAGFRNEESDGDYVNYRNWFDYSFDQDWQSLLGRDPIFQLLGLLLRSSSGELTWLMLVVCALALALKARALASPAYRSFLGLSLIFLVGRFYLVHEFTQVRAALGVALASLGIVLMFEGRAARGLVFFIAGVASHISTIALVPIALVVLQGKWRLGCAVATALGALGLVALPGALDTGDLATRLLPYLTGEYPVERNTLLSFFFIAKSFAATAILLAGRRVPRQIKVAAWIVLYGCALTAIFIQTDILSLRFGELSAVFDCVCLAYLFRHMMGGPVIVRVAVAVVVAAGFFRSATEVVHPYGSVIAAWGRAVPSAAGTPGAPRSSV